MTKLRELLKGNKTYLTAAIGVLGALVAWADGSIDLLALAGAAWVAIQACFIHAAAVRSAGTAANLAQDAKDAKDGIR